MSKRNRPFDKEPYLPLPYGHEGLIQKEVGLRLAFNLIGEESKEILLTYRVAYVPEESKTLNIEDIYACNTPRFMQLECLHGEIFPYKS